MADTISIPGNGCACCHGGYGGKLECRTRGGIYTLCGFDEFTSPSVPPKKYLAMRFSGSVHGDIYILGSSCSTQPSGGPFYFDEVWSGEARFDPSPCALVSLGARKLVEVPWGTTHSTLSGFSLASGCSGSVAKTKTTARLAANGACCSTSTSDQIVRGSLQASLTSEDTEAAAIARATGSMAWSEWGVLGSGCCAYISERTEFSGSFQEAEWRATAKCSFTAVALALEIDYSRGPIGGPKEHYATEQLTVACSGGGDLDTPATVLAIGQVPNAVGYETCVSGWRFKRYTG